MTYEQVLTTKIKPFGWWQLSIFLLFYVANSLPLIFLLRLPNIGPEHVCTSPWFNAANWSYNQIVNFSSAIDAGMNMTDGKDIRCFRYPTSVYETLWEKSFRQNLSWDSMVDMVSNSDIAQSNVSLERCGVGDWRYDEANAPFRHSLVQDFDLVCRRQYYIPMTTFFFIVGIFFGTFFSSVLCDCYGRKRIACIVQPMCAILLLQLFFCNSYPILVATYFLVGIISPVSYIACFVLCIEVTTAKYRNLFSVFDGVWLNIIGQGSIILVASLTQDWRMIFVTTGLMCSFAFSYTCLLPESPKWLIAKGRYEEALHVIRAAIRMNGKSSGGKAKTEQVTLEDIIPSSTSPDEKLKEHSSSISVVREIRATFASYRRFLTTPQSYRLWMLLAVAWFMHQVAAIGVAYYGVRLNGDPYVIAMMTALISLPSRLLQWLVYRWFDRKRPIVALLLFASACCFGAFCSSIIFSTQHVTVVILATLAVLPLSCLFGMLTLYSSELFPTLYRNSALGFLYAMGAIGGAFGAYSERLDTYVWDCLPMLLYGVALLVGALSIATLPLASVEALSDDFEKEIQYTDVATTDETPPCA